MTSTDVLKPAFSDSANKIDQHLLTVDLIARGTPHSSSSSARFKSRVKAYDIVASVLSSEARPHLQLVTQSERLTSSGAGDRWLHIAADCTSLAEVQAYVVDTAAQKSDDSAQVAEALLKYICDDFEEMSSPGSYIRPGTVLRCDGIHSQNIDRLDTSITFVSFPYFDVGKDKGPAACKTDHNVRSLYQQFYPREETQDLDGDQRYKHFMNLEANMCLRVPQLWMFVLDSTTVITCGPTALDKMIPDFLDIFAEDELPSTWPELVQISDFPTQITYIRIHDCKTYEALCRSIETKCFLDEESEVDSYCLHIGDNEEELSADDWPAIVKDAHTQLIRIQIRCKQFVSVPSQDDTQSSSLSSPISCVNSQHRTSEGHSHSGTQSIDTEGFPQSAWTSTNDMDQERQTIPLVGIETQNLQLDQHTASGDIGTVVEETSTANPDPVVGTDLVDTTVKPVSNKTQIPAALYLTETHIRHLIKDEISVAMKHYNDGVESPMQGYLEQAILHPYPEKLEQGTSSDHYAAGSSKHSVVSPILQPTNFRIRTEYLDIETLHYYDIPYEFDADPNYIVVLRKMSQRETDILFEHTRILRSRYGDRLSVQSGAFGPTQERKGNSCLRFIERENTAAKMLDSKRPRVNITKDGNWSGQGCRLGPSKEESMRHRNLTPESRILILLNYLAFCPIKRGEHVLHHYQTYLRSLRYEVNSKPSKNLLKRLFLFEEEVEVVASVITQQKATFAGLQVVYNSSTYRTPTRIREKAFIDFENAAIEAIKTEAFMDIERDIGAMIKESKKLAEAVRHNIAVVEEGNSKAIFIFTLITIIFLPLSFISSIFGMNTADVREMDSTQALFWAIALPVTVAIGGLSLLAAYGGQTWRQLKDSGLLSGSLIKNDIAKTSTEAVAGKARWHQSLPVLLRRRFLASDSDMTSVA